MDAQRAWEEIAEGRFVADHELIWDWWNEEAPDHAVVGETIASQLPGRENGGAADAYRHILLSAEFTRRYGPDTAYDVLTNHELETRSGADNGLDMWNNSIGIRIGQYVRDSEGSWNDVVRLSRAAIHGSFTTTSYAEVASWKKRKADDGIRKSYQHYLELHRASWNPLKGDPKTFAEFAKPFNQTYAFRSREGEIVLESGKLTLDAAAMTSSKHWRNHPKVQVNGKKVELAVSQSQFPSDAWFEGNGFVYEPGNAAPGLVFTPQERRQTQRSDSREFPLPQVPVLEGAAQIPWPEFDDTLPQGSIGLPLEDGPEAGSQFLPGDRAFLDLQETGRPLEPAFAATEPTDYFRKALSREPGSTAGNFHQMGAVTPTSFDAYLTLGTDPVMEARALQEFGALYRQSFVDLGGDADAAKVLATERFSQNWGLSKLAPEPEGTVLELPAEKVYPDAGGSGHAYLHSEAEHYLKKSGISAYRWYLSPNDNTRSDWRQGGRDAQGYGPRLTLTYDDETGAGRLATDRFQARLPDAATSNAA